MFKLAKDIIKTKFNVLNKFHEPKTNTHIHTCELIYEDRTKFSNSYDPTNVLTKFHEESPINVAYISSTSFRNSHIKKCEPSRSGHVLQQTGSHVFRRTISVFKLSGAIKRTNILTKFHKKWTINVTSIVKCPAPGGHCFTITALSPGGHVFQQTEIIFELVQAAIGVHLLTECRADCKLNVASIM
ncbi:hypothetical protein DPMN_155466 [Dreissena polymorpha]|uniref:Uncharacterized protein n=1 Tax=Dreissena polymorpha TaxID=45954 RepID=A0A9D4FMA1_DREPO|nr:hypothetical protein DPMN_155466 [Dreissena polymorpha]